MEWIFIIFAVILTIGLAMNIVKITFHVVKNDPNFALKAAGSSLFVSSIGFLIDGYFSIKIVLFGVVGFVIYVLYLYITET